MTDPSRLHPPSATLSQVVRGALFLRLDADRIDATFSQWVMLIAMAIGLQFASDYYAVGRYGELSLYGLPFLLFKVPVVVVIAWALTRATRQLDKTLMFTVTIYGIAVAIGCFSEILLRLLRSVPAKSLISTPETYYLLQAYLAPVWLGLAAAAAAVRLLGLSGRKLVFALLPAAFLFWIPLFQSADYQTLWVRPYDSESAAREQSRYDALIEERAFYSQPRLLDEALSSLIGSPNDAIGLYFVGVAGYSSQDVFMKEVRYVSNFFKARFATSGRTITLINNPETVLEDPIASVTSLRRSLAKIGELMDTDKDILFLYLTSHGSQEHRLSLEFGSMRLENLDPATLRLMLDESGIKRRVIVVSACYSGGFVEPLKNADTLVITASAPDRQSHGCSNEADFTFFGKAYFQDGLRHAASFVEAFDIAKPLVTEREIRDGYEPSQPMLSIGADIATALEQFSLEQLASKRKQQEQDKAARLSESR